MSAMDMTGQRFGRLTVIKRDGSSNNGRNAAWMCRCDCGGLTRVVGTTLRRGESASCGCLRAEVSAARELRHGHSVNGITPTYAAWAGAKQRCTNPKSPAFDRYGGRGISICERWKNSFENFLADMGEAPLGLTLDRFPDNNGNYELGNCRWATRKEQANNRRPRRKLMEV